MCLVDLSSEKAFKSDILNNNIYMVIRGKNFTFRVDGSVFWLRETRLLELKKVYFLLGKLPVEGQKTIRCNER